MHSQILEMIDHYGVTELTRSFLNKKMQMYIGGRFVDSEKSESIDVIEPSTGKLLTSIPSSTEGDVDCAVDAAHRALENGPWASMKPNERQRILHKIADLIEQRAQTLGEIETLDNGKALGPCIDMDILGGADLIRFMAGYATKIEGATRHVSAEGQHFAYTLKEPIGVVAAIVPWNWPFNMAIWKIAAPLAAGCTIVLKPAQQTSLSMLYFAELCEEAGLPHGVLNIITGRGGVIGGYLAGHPMVNKVSFTGSTEIGRRVGAAAGRALTPVTLELGGKSPMIAFEDADVEALAAATRWSVFFNAGQVCSAGSRLYAHRSIIDKVVESLIAIANGMTMAPGLDVNCDIGPVISQERKNSIQKYIGIGKKEGAKIAYGGSEIEGDGFFVEPTIFVCPDNSMQIVQEEIFGPVLAVVPFEDEEEALKLANDTIYGLGASIWTRDISRAHRLIPRLKVGTVWVNAHDLIDSAMPFGGEKSSGFGKDLGAEQFQQFLKSKAVWINVDHM